MGDAILAAFTDEAKATSWGRRSADRIRSNSGRSESTATAIGIKLGIYAGACYVVTANGALDYFGQDVNVASRVQHLAGSGEARPQGVFDALDASLRKRLTVIEKLEASVKGAWPIDSARARARWEEASLRAEDGGDG